MNEIVEMHRMEINTEPAEDVHGNAITVGATVRVTPPVPDGAQPWFGDVVAVDIEQSSVRAWGQPLTKQISIQPHGRRYYSRTPVPVRATCCEVMPAKAQAEA